MLFETPKLNDYEKKVIHDIHSARDNLRYAITSLPRWNGLLRRTTFARALQGSNSIEGIHVTVEDAMAAVDGDAPLNAESEVWAAIMGYRGAMTYVLQLSNDPHFSYGEGFIRSLHFMMLGHDLSKHPGKWRPGPIYVRDERTGQRVYEGPDAELIPPLIAEFIHRLNKEGGSEIVRAAMSHLNLVMIHPFSDGNGRMARCLQTLVMAREGIVEPWFCSIEEYLGRNTQAYYDVLAHVGQGKWSPGNDARPWLHFCLTAHYRQAKTLLRRSKEMRSIWDELEQEIKRRGLPERVQFALSDATLGYKVRNAGYRSAAGISDNLASRDLKLLVDQGLLIPSGENKARVYAGSTVLKVIRDKCREPRSEADPIFGTTAYLPGFEPYKL